MKPVHSMTRRRLLAGALVTIVLTGCTGTATPVTQPTHGAAVNSTPNMATPIPSQIAVLKRTVKHAMGETGVPANPQRVVVLDTGELDSVLVLGITPVGAERLI